VEQRARLQCAFNLQSYGSGFLEVAEFYIFLLFDPFQSSNSKGQEGCHAWCGILKRKSSNPDCPLQTSANNKLRLKINLEAT
jgi:hypothetical protein